MQPLQNTSSCASWNDGEQQQLEVWNNTYQPYPKELRVPELFSRRAETTPDAIAITADCMVMSYRELEHRSNRLAHHLRALGVGPDVLVGVCVERSPLMVLGALAVLKAGGAYIPVDMSHPIGRIAFMLDDANPRVLLTQTSLASRLPASGRETILLDRELSPSADWSPSAPAQVGSARDLAYVIYTSGSTGQPKGVEIAHDNLLNLIFWHQRTFSITAADQGTQMASPGFDAAVWELWPYLTAGACVHFVPELVRSHPERLQDWLVETKISISFLPTPLAERILQLDWPANTALRVLLTGADVLHRYLPDNVPFLLVNNYGPTECTVVATSGPVLNQKRTDVLPAIGRPIANTQIYILDEEMRPVSIGSCGEICIGGAGLARGYRNRPDLTSERFAANPFSNISGDRLYKTGDLGRFLPDGQIAFLGRVDDQVKVRGCRIELNEIVSVLSRHPAVRESAVVASANGDGEKHLVAYVVPHRFPAPTVGELREFLGKKLPEYMLPTTFVRLDALPVSANGKLDRAALPVPSDENMICDEAFVGPSNPTEKRIASILSTLLDLEGVGVNDNFFLLGGNSLLGTQVIARLRDAFDVEFSLLSLFDHPTVRGIAGEVERLLVTKLEATSEDEVERLLGMSAEQADI